MATSVVGVMKMITPRAGIKPTPLAFQTSMTYSNDCTTTSSSPVRSETVLHDCGTSPASLSYDRPTAFQIYDGGDMMPEMRRRKPEPTLLQTKDIPQHIGLVREELAFDDAVIHTQQSKPKWAEVMAWKIEPPTFRLGV